LVTWMAAQVYLDEHWHVADRTRSCPWTRSTSTTPTETRSKSPPGAA